MVFEGAECKAFLLQKRLFLTPSSQELNWENGPEKDLPIGLATCFHVPPMLLKCTVTQEIIEQVLGNQGCIFPSFSTGMSIGKTYGKTAS